jgi:hypothetical protein
LRFVVVIVAFQNLSPDAIKFFKRDGDLSFLFSVLGRCFGGCKALAATKDWKEAALLRLAFG